MNKRFSAVAASCFVFMCGNAARANMIPFDPSEFNKDGSRTRQREQPKEAEEKQKNEEKDSDKDNDSGRKKEAEKK